MRLDQLITEKLRKEQAPELELELNVIERVEARKLKNKPTVVKKYKGEKELEQGLTLMATLGYVTQNQASRKAMYSAAAGILTRKQIHTVTFVKEAS
jgi:hypothetical protein